jgi:hypothetical protein
MLLIEKGSILHTAEFVRIFQTLVPGNSGTLKRMDEQASEVCSY